MEIILNSKSCKTKFIINFIVCRIHPLFLLHIFQNTVYMEKLKSLEKPCLFFLQLFIGYFHSYNYKNKVQNSVVGWRHLASIADVSKVGLHAVMVVIRFITGVKG